MTSLPTHTGIRRLHAADDELWDAAARLVARGLRRHHAAPLSGVTRVDVEALAPGALTAFRTSEHADPSVLHERPGTVRTVLVHRTADGRTSAALAATLRHCAVGDPEHSYLPTRHAQLSWAATLVDTTADLADLGGLWAVLQGDLRAARITEVCAPVWSSDPVTGAFWRGHGFRPDGVLAGRRTDGPPLGTPSAVQVRWAALSDLEALVEQLRQEQQHHALHTATGTLPDQDVEANRAVVRGWFPDEPVTAGSSGVVGTLVATTDDDRVIGCAHLLRQHLPVDSASRLHLPVDHGYLAAVNTDEAWRGRGVGQALTAAALTAFRDLGLEHAFLHHIDDNTLARPFWSRMGFAPVMEILRGHVPPTCHRGDHP